MARRRIASNPTQLALLPLLLALIFSVPMIAQPPQVAPLRTITNAGEAHGLSHAEASKGYPIHLRAVVT